MNATPNVLFILTDQQRWDSLGASGNPDVHTPNLDRLASTGTYFTNCHVQNPVCMPSRASILAGRYPSALGITDMGVPFPENEAHLATYFSRAGYETAYFGKLHFLPHANRDHTLPHPDYGYDQIAISDEPGVYEDAYRAWVRARAPSQLDLLSFGLPPARATWLKTMGWNDTVQHPAPPAGTGGGRHDAAGPVAFPGRDDCTHTAFVRERTLDFLRRRRDGQPFLCVASFYPPHAPWRTPQKYLDLYQPDQLQLPENLPEPVGDHLTETQLRAARHGYYAMVSEVDDAVGSLMDGLREQGLEDNTIVVFLSDHGEWLGEHGRFGKGYPAHDAVSRVPCIFRVPGQEPRCLDGLVEAVDVLPTLLELCGLTVSSRLQGRSLANTCKGGDFCPRSSALIEQGGWSGLRTPTHRYNLRADATEHLFDLEASPSGHVEVTQDPAHASALSQCRKELALRQLQIRQPHLPIWRY
jgi:arylsulfatase A-like enzyme